MPFGVLDVELGRRLGEREVAGAQAAGEALTEEGLGEGLDRAGQVGEGDAAVDHQALDLVEDGEVGGIGGLVTEHPPRHDHVDRWGRRLHHPDLHR